MWTSLEVIFLSQTFYLPCTLSQDGMEDTVHHNRWRPEVQRKRGGPGGPLPNSPKQGRASDWHRYVSKSRMKPTQSVRGVGERAQKFRWESLETECRHVLRKLSK